MRKTHLFKISGSLLKWAGQILRCICKLNVCTLMTNVVTCETVLIKVLNFFRRTLTTRRLKYNH